MPGTIWLLLGVVVADRRARRGGGRRDEVPAAGCPIDPAKTSLTGIYLSQAIVAILAVLAIGSEYGSGMIRVTLDRHAAPDHGPGRQGGRR